MTLTQRVASHSAMTSPPPRTRQSISGIGSIPQLFARAFDEASARLAAGDLGRIWAVPRGRVTELGWMPDVGVAEFRKLMQTLSRRPRADRYRLHHQERRRAIDLLGGEEAFDDPKRMFVAAFLIDEAFDRFAEDDAGENTGHGFVSPHPPSLLGHINNPPPPLGQMTAHAICQRWMHNMWLSGNPRTLRGFGHVPEVSIHRVSGRTKARLEAVRRAERLRLACICWRRSSLKVERTGDRSFRVTGYEDAAPPDGMTRVLDSLARLQIDIAVFPEVSLDATDYKALVDGLASRGRLHPTMCVAGLVHSQNSHAWSNEGVILDGSGTEILRHEKLEPFPDDQNRWLEDIIPRASHVYNVLDTPVGRVVINVCRDIRSDVPMLLNRIVAASLIFVPAHSNGLEFVFEEARILGQRQSAIVVSANPVDAGLRHCACVYAPIRGFKATPESDLGFAMAERASARKTFCPIVWTDIQVGDFGKGEAGAWGWEDA